MLYPIELGVRTCHAANRQDVMVTPNKTTIAAMHEPNHITDRQRSEGACETVLAHPLHPLYDGLIQNHGRQQLRLVKWQKSTPAQPSRRRETFAKTKVRHAQPDAQARRATQRGPGMSRRLDPTPASP